MRPHCAQERECHGTTGCAPGLKKLDCAIRQLEGNQRKRSQSSEGPVACQDESGGAKFTRWRRYPGWARLDGDLIASRRRARRRPMR